MKELCRYFIRGFCRYGRNCKFSHASPSPAQIQNHNQNPSKPSTNQFGSRPSKFSQKQPQQQPRKPTPSCSGQTSSSKNHNQNPTKPSTNQFGSRLSKFSQKQPQQQPLKPTPSCSAQTSSSKPFKNRWMRSTSTSFIQTDQQAPASVLTLPCDVPEKSFEEPHALDEARLGPSSQSSSKPSTNPSQQQQKGDPSGIVIQNTSSTTQLKGPSKSFERKRKRSAYSCTDCHSWKSIDAYDSFEDLPQSKRTCYKDFANPQSSKSIVADGIMQEADDVMNEGPLCSPCYIHGDASFEELRAQAYEKAKQGLSLHSISKPSTNSSQQQQKGDPSGIVIRNTSSTTQLKAPSKSFERKRKRSTYSCTDCHSWKSIDAYDSFEDLPQSKRTCYKDCANPQSSKSIVADGIMQEADDVMNEGPLCSPCYIHDGTSFEELRAQAYEEAKQGFSCW